jgi:prepilin-type N-terminal cleavage/methylation domain-containing protein
MRFCKRGFTLIELLISVAIIGIVTTMVLVNYKSFDNATLLKSKAYEIAIMLREAQVKSVSSVRSGANSADYAYGMSFTKGSSAFNTFVFKSASGVPNYTDPGVERILASELGRTMIVTDLCYDNNGTPQCGGNIDRLDVSFRRPEFTGLFYSPQGQGNNPLIGNASAVYIKLGSTQGSGLEFVVKISKLGQISVTIEE